MQEFLKGKKRYIAAAGAALLAVAAYAGGEITLGEALTRAIAAVAGGGF